MRRLWIVGAALGLLGLAVSAQADLKIGVVDMGALLQAHPDTQGAEDLLENQAAEYEEEKNELLGRFKAMKQAFEDARAEASNKALSEAGREQKREAAREKLNELQAFDREVRETTLKRQKDLADQGDRMRRRIVKQLRETVNAYAGEKKYDLVLDTANRGISGVESVVFTAQKLDITQAVIEQLKKDAQ